jgi:hypothetical protein
MGRFLAITGIVALGCGFLAGLQMSGRDMRLAADRWFDGCKLYDLRLVSTKGFSEKDVERVSSTEGVTAVMPSSSTDVMARVGNEQMAVRITSLDADAAQAATSTSDETVESSDNSYLNRVHLTAGRWPQSADECLLDGDAATPGLEVGDTVEVLYGTDDLDGTLSVRTFTVVGLMSSPSYPYTGTFGTTTLGDGSVKQVAYVLPSAFSDDYPWTTLYLSVDGADAAVSGSSSYEDAISPTKEALSARLDELAQARLDDLRQDAQAKVDDAQASSTRSARTRNRSLRMPSRSWTTRRSRLPRVRKRLPPAGRNSRMAGRSSNKSAPRQHRSCRTPRTRSMPTRQRSTSSVRSSRRARPPCSRRLAPPRSTRRPPRFLPRRSRPAQVSMPSNSRFLPWRRWVTLRIRQRSRPCALSLQRRRHHSTR